MPEAAVRVAWREVRGNVEPYVATGEIVALSAQLSLAEDSTPTVGIAREMAQLFKVSGQSMQIRLQGMRLIQTQEREPDLFNKAEEATESV